jgi:hypothetical protein
MRQVAGYGSGVPVATITELTLQNTRARYEELSRDAAVDAVFGYLVAFAASYRGRKKSGEGGPAEAVSSERLTPLAVVRELRSRVPGGLGSAEFSQLALSAAADAVGAWSSMHSTGQGSLFDTRAQVDTDWQSLGSGAGFCELARLYFGKLTERYLRYFLDRAAFATLPDTQARSGFLREVESHLDDISKHAFETAKITQSFAAGWFNKHAGAGSLNATTRRHFLSHAFGKLRDELRREQVAV